MKPGPLQNLCCLAIVMAIAAAVWLPTLGWGLPTRATDKALFGGRTPWTGEQILALLATSQPTTARGADVDANPIVDRSQPIVLNDTDAKRAEIVRRYRLMSGQPDEFIQFKALAEMSGRSGLSKLDPRLYQYGGLWIYPVGGLLRGAMAVGLIERPPAGVNAMAFYLDHPEAFGRFYVVARAYSAFWGFVALAAIFVLTRRAADNAWLAAFAAIAFALLPVVRTATHEAKPHLAGAAIALWSVIAAGRYVAGGRRRWLLIAGVLCGASTAMVVSMALSIVVVPTAWWLRMKNARPRHRRRGQDEGAIAGTVGDARAASESVSPRQADAPSPQPSPPITRQRGQEVVALFGALLAAAIVYAVTNPFVVLNALFHRDLLVSNLGNSTAMYGVGGVLATVSSLVRIAVVGIADIGIVLVVLMLGLLVPSRFAVRATDVRLLAVCVGAFAVQFAVLSAGKPAEYVRFAIAPIAAICVFGAIGFARLMRPATNATSVFGLTPVTARLAVAALLVALLAASHLATIVKPINADAGLARLNRERPGPLSLAVAYEPAPWSMAPADLFQNQIVLVPVNAKPITGYDAFVYPSNLATQIGRPAAGEHADWMRNVFVFEPGAASVTAATLTTRR